MRPAGSDEHIPARLAALFLLVPLVYLSALAWLGRSISLLSDDWGLMGVGSAFFTTPWPGPFYRPLVRVWFHLAATYSWSPALLHTANIALHAVVSFLVFLLYREMLGDRRLATAGMAAILFMVLPIHTDNVFWISGQFDVVCAVFFLLALLLYLRFLSGRTLLRLFLAILFFWGALLSKEMALSLPGVLLVVTAFKGRLLRRNTWYLLAPLLLSYSLYFLVRWCVTGYPLHSPVNLNLSFPRAIRSLAIAVGSFFRTDTCIPGLAVLLLTGLFAALSMRDRELRRDVFLVLSILVVSLVPLVGHVARWYLYIPSVFACLIVVRAWLSRSWKRPVRRTFAVLIALLMLYYGVKLAGEGTMWHEASSIGERTLTFLSEVISRNGGELYLVNVPSAYAPRGGVGEKPVFAYNLPLALSKVSGLDVEDRMKVINHLWLLKDIPGISTVSRVDGNTFVVKCGDSGFFSFHTPEFVSGRTKPNKLVLTRPWGQLEILDEKELKLRLDQPGGRTILFYDGHSWSRI